MIKKIEKFQEILDVNFNNHELLIKALTHKSANSIENNEKLEFLGDRVIGMSLSKKLFELYPNENEGVLDKRFARLVNRETCSDIAWSIKIQDFIIIGDKKKIITKKDDKILSDCCEAVIGAIFLDKGYEFTNKFILRIWKKEIDDSGITVLDSKTKLQEHSLKKFKKLPAYNLISSSGPRHNPTYRIEVSITGSKKFVGIGKSKQDAELDGAKKLLEDNNIS